MQIIYHGIDLVDCRRIEKMLNRHSDRFLNRVFTPVEQRYSRKHRHSTERLAARFAVKEAVMKMLGTGWQNGVSWTDIETQNDPLGKPKVVLHGKTAELARKTYGSFATAWTVKRDYGILNMALPILTLMGRTESTKQSM